MKDSNKLYTDLAITKNSTVNLKKYFDSIKRNLPENWVFLKEENYQDSDTFKILNDVICIRTPYLRNTHLKITFHAKIFIGLTDQEIFILKILFSEDIQMPDKVFGINHVIELYHNKVLKKNKYYENFDHKLEFGGPSDENFYQSDIRNERMLRVFSKSDNHTYVLAKGGEAKIDKQKVIFFTPNNISLTLSLMKKSYKNAFNIHKELFGSKKEKTIKMEESDQTELYNYFEEALSSIIFAYISVEAMANAAIPEEYEKEKVNEKGIKEIWSKENIERWTSTSEKIGDILPEILKSGDIKKESFWVHFKELEKLRNELIHQKTNAAGTKLDSSFFKELIDPKVFLKIKSAISVIKYFYDLDNAHPYFPLGLGIAKVRVEEVESITDHFGKLEEVK